MPTITSGLIALAVLVPFIAATALLQCADGHRHGDELQSIDGRAPLLQFAMTDLHEQVEHAVGDQATGLVKDAIIKVAAR